MRILNVKSVVTRSGFFVFTNFTVLYVNKSSLKSAQRAPKPIVVKTKRETKKERFLLFYGAPLGNFCEDTETKEKRSRGKNLSIVLSKS